MDPKKILHADYLDIIFDNRNKAYGGYELRRHYNRRVGKSVGLLLLSVVALASSALLRPGQTDTQKASTKPIVCSILPIDITPKIDPPKPPKTPPSAPHQALTKPFTPPVITDAPIPPDQQMTANKDLHPATPGSSFSGSDSTGIDVPVRSPGNGVIPTPPTDNKPKIWVDQMPQFTGDMGAFIGSHLRYPDAARESNISGKVLIQFVVNEDGTVTDAKVARGIGGGCDEEALRMVLSMPKWHPGRQNGQPVKVYFTLPIKFELN